MNTFKELDKLLCMLYKKIMSFFFFRNNGNEARWIIGIFDKDMVNQETDAESKF